MESTRRPWGMSAVAACEVLVGAACAAAPPAEPEATPVVATATASEGQPPHPHDRGSTTPRGDGGVVTFGPGTGTLDPAVEAFCAEVHPRLVGSLVLLCGDHGVAEELTQDTLARVSERWDGVRRMDHPVSWAHRVAYNLVSSHFRRRSAERRAHQRHGAEGEGQPEPDVAAVLTVRDALRHLPERHAGRGPAAGPACATLGGTRGPRVRAGLT